MYLDDIPPNTLGMFILKDHLFIAWLNKCGINSWWETNHMVLHILLNGLNFKVQC